MFLIGDTITHQMKLNRTESTSRRTRGWDPSRRAIPWGELIIIYFNIPHCLICYLWLPCPCYYIKIKFESNQIKSSRLRVRSHVFIYFHGQFLSETFYTTFYRFRRVSYVITFKFNRIESNQVNRRPAGEMPLQRLVHYENKPRDKTSFLKKIYIHTFLSVQMNPS